MSHQPIAFEPALTSEEAARLLNIHPKTLQRMARKGQVPAHRIEDLWRFRASELAAWFRGKRDRLDSPLVP
jgi:excisionase family DNA binding protein